MAKTKTIAEEKEAQKEIDDAKFKRFVDDYKALCDVHGLTIASEMVYTPQGIATRTIAIKQQKDDKSSK